MTITITNVPLNYFYNDHLGQLFASSITFLTEIIFKNSRMSAIFFFWSKKENCSHPTIVSISLYEVGSELKQTVLDLGLDQDIVIESTSMNHTELQF